MSLKNINTKEIKKVKRSGINDKIKGIKISLQGLMFISYLLFFIIFTMPLCAKEGDPEKTSSTTDAAVEQMEITGEKVGFLYLTLKKSLALALKNNYDIKIARINPDIREYEIAIAKSRFDPVFKFVGELREDNLPINSQLISGLQQTPIIPSPSGFPQFFNDRRFFTTSLETLLPTGATFTLEYNFVRSFIDPNPFNPVNPAGTTYMETRFRQPLLKDFGLFKTRSPIYIARNNKKISLQQFKSVAINVVNSVQIAYWNLVKAIEDLRVSKISLKRATDLLNKNRVQVEVGTLAPIELVQAEEGVASQQEAVIIAENNVKDKEDELKKILNLDNGSFISEATIIPLDKSIFTPKETDINESIKIALANRPDLLEKQLMLENANINVKQKKNELLPRLDFTTGIRYSGLGSDFDDSNEGLFSEEFQGEFFGINLDVPIGLRSGRNNYKNAKLQEKQTQLDIEKKEVEIVVEVRNAVRQIQTNMERINATSKAKELAAKRLEAEEKKFEVGRSTSLEVLRAQERLAIAEGNANKAIIDYNISLKNLEAVQGVILEENDIVIEEGMGW